MSELKHTPGPWRWELNKNARTVQLCGGARPYDLTVMDFVRWGMDSAEPRFLDPRRPEMMLLEKADVFAKPVSGREHHTDWFQTINTPDANLIAAAPDLLEALIQLTEWANRAYADLTNEGVQPANHPISKGIEAINKATQP